MAVYKKIIVGIDFSDKTDRAVHAALGLAKATGGTVVLVHVVPPAVDGQRGAPGSDTEVTRTIEQRLQDQAKQLTASSGAAVDYGVCEGEVVPELVRYVERWGGDVIVAATEGRTGLGRILVGSVAERLLQKSPVPVLVVGPEVR